MRVCDAFPTACDVAKAIDAGRTTATEVVESFLDRIARLNPRLNAVVTLDADGARRAARQADAARAGGEPLGSLHGVPITIKDSFETAGLRTASGDRYFAHHVPVHDAAVVASLKAAGAIVLGKTNLPALANGIQTDNVVFGRTNNPWDPARTPGGSSGGAAAAVAAALSCFDFGSDIGGSIRIPCHFCGVFGLKATGGRLNGTGHLASRRRLTMPAGWRPLLELAAFGPIARSIDDLRLAFAAVTDPSASNAPPALDRPPRRQRIAWNAAFGGAPLSADSRLVIEQLARDLEGLGYDVACGEPAGFDYDEAWYVAGVCLGAVNSMLQSPLVRQVRRIVGLVLSAARPRDALMRGLIVGVSLREAAVREALNRRERIIDQIERFFEATDAWICPIFPVPAFTHRGRHAPIQVDTARVTPIRANLLHNVIFNLTGHPAVVIPAGRSAEGLPIGVQVIGRRFGEMRLLDAAGEIMRAAPGYRRPPGC